MKPYFPRSSFWIPGALLFVMTLMADIAIAQTSTKAKHPVDINSASIKTLESLPGITPALAHKIADGRPYKNIQDVQTATGLSNKKISAIKDNIIFGSGATASGEKSTAGKKTTSSGASGDETSTSSKHKSSTPEEQPLPDTVQTTHGEKKSLSPTGASAGRMTPGQTVNINTATAEELDALPGIGPTKAQAIINYRNEHGQFNSIEEIQKVKGIKEGEFAKIKDYIRLK